MPRQVVCEAVNIRVSVNFTLSAGLTVIGHKTVGRFYNPRLWPIVLTIVFPGKLRISQVGTELACIEARWC